MILLDSNIVIEILNNNHKILSTIQNWSPEDVFISVVTKWEVLAGAPNKPNQNLYHKALNRYNIIHLDQQISELTGILLQTYRLSHGLRIPDALIAATAVRNKLLLITLNTKDFQYIQGLSIQTA
ncbi:MAG: type II toxin-antitoxin system VapC family toxin [Bacteroidota bacterium]